MDAVFPPWPIREFRDRSDGIPESGREDRRFRGAGAFFGRIFAQRAVFWRACRSQGLDASQVPIFRCNYPPQKPSKSTARKSLVRAVVTAKRTPLPNKYLLRSRSESESPKVLFLGKTVFR